MLAHQLQRILAIEAVVLSLLAWTLGGRFIDTWLWLWIGVRAITVAGTFVAGWLYRGEAWRRHAPDALQALRMYGEELFAYVALFSVLQPFERRFMAPDRLRAPATGETPILLVHGYQCNRAAWYWWRRWLEARGHCVATVNLEPPQAGIDELVAPLAQRIEEVCAATGAPQLRVIAHSMGGLAVRAYLRQHGAGRVAALLTLGTPHRGSVLARLAWGRNGAQMRPASAWLADLPPIDAPAAALYSAQDNFVLPQESARVDARAAIELHGVGHLAMALPERCAPLALSALDTLAAQGSPGGR